MIKKRKLPAKFYKIETINEFLARGGKITKIKQFATGVVQKKKKYVKIHK